MLNDCGTIGNKYTPKYYSYYSLLLGQNDEGFGDIENMETDEDVKPPVDNTAGMFKPLIITGLIIVYTWYTINQ